MEQSKEYEPAICVHRLPNGFSSWTFHSGESGSGPSFYHDVSVCVCSQCGTIRVAGFRQGKDGNMNRFTEEINIHSAIAIDAIIKYANYIHGDEVWTRSKPDYAALEARCVKYEKALKEIAKTALVVGQPSFMWQANEALNGGGKEAGKTFTIDQVDKMLIEFALTYHNNPHKDIANDAAEYLTDKVKENKQ